MTLARTSISRTRFWSCGCATSAASASWNALGHSEVYRVKCADCRVKVERVPLLPRKAPFSKRFADAVGQASAGSQWFHAPGSSRSGFRRPSACCATAHRTSGWVPAVRARAVSAIFSPACLAIRNAPCSQATSAGEDPQYRWNRQSPLDGNSAGARSAGKLSACSSGTSHGTLTANAGPPCAAKCKTDVTSYADGSRPPTPRPPVVQRESARNEPKPISGASRRTSWRLVA
jgi:hypothetical protein